MLKIDRRVAGDEDDAAAGSFSWSLSAEIELELSCFSITEAGDSPDETEAVSPSDSIASLPLPGETGGAGTIIIVIENDATAELKHWFGYYARGWHT